MTLPIVLLGCGQWGSRVLEAMQRHPRLNVVAVIDPEPRARAVARRIAPAANVLVNLGDPLVIGVHAAYVATPPELHQRHGCVLLDAGYDVLLEKPVCTSVAEARQLRRAAQRRGGIVMAGHLLRFHPAYEALVERAREGAIGRLRHVFARRVSTSHSADVLRRLAPHDLATLYALDGSRVLACRAAQRGDDVIVRLRLASGLSAQLELSTRGPERQRVFRLVGEAGELVVDELEDVTPLRFVHLASAQPGRPAMRLDGAQDPLHRQLDHFAQCVVERSPPRTDLREAEWTVSAIEQARAAFRAAGIAEAV